MGKIKIINPGLLTLVQDSGRYGYQQFGVPVSGVMDSFAHRVGNILVDNNEEEAVLEITMLGPQIEFLEDEVIAITGGNLSPRINGSPVSMWESKYVSKGDRLTFGEMKNGCRSYIAFSGGINVPKVMKSKATYMKAQIGGFQGRKLKAGDILDIGSCKNKINKIGERSFLRKYTPKYKGNNEIRVILGPQNEYFTNKGINTFLNSEYIVTNESDRMGFRLEGDEIEHVEGGDIISDGIAMGAIQIPGHGKPIIMMADRQTTGGYTKIANVISVDLWKVAQSKPGDKIKFKEIPIEKAHRLLAENEALINSIKEECKRKDIIDTKQFNIKINGQKYEVKVEELG